MICEVFVESNTGLMKDCALLL